MALLAKDKLNPLRNRTASLINAPLRRSAGPGVGGGNLFAVLAGLLLLASPLPAVSQTTSTETSIKAVYLFHFAQFVDWPESTFASPQTPFVIGIYGDESLASNVEEAVAGETVRGRKIVVRRCASADDFADCQVLFISRSRAASLDSVLARIKGKSILTVSDIDNFTSRGGMIRFLTERNRVHFRINTEEPPKVGLTISSKLLRLAERVTPGKA